MNRPFPILNRRHRRSLLCAGLFLLTALAMPFASLHAGGGRYRVAGPEVAIDPARGAIVVDGDLGEWDESRSMLLTLANSGMTEVESAYQEFTARVSFRYDEEALYVAVWWNDPTPLGPEKNDGYFPTTDGLVLDFPLSKGMAHVALWRDPATQQAQAVVSHDNQPLDEGTKIDGVQQVFKVTGPTSYVQEARIPWKAIGEMPLTGEALRIGVQLCFGGFDDMRGYVNFQKKLRGEAENNDRWGGNLAIGFMDGFASADVQKISGYDPANGAVVTLAPAGTASKPVAPSLILGDEQTRTTEMVAVPAGKIVIDGVLGEGEWDEKASSVLAYEPTAFPNRYAARVFWAYNDQGLYIALRWFTGGPQFNMNNPLEFNRGYDGGDDVQIRLGTDRVSHIDTWLHTESKTPAMKIDYGVKMNEGKIEHALREGAQMALKETEDGYVQEIFLPWSLITASGKPMKEGDTFRTILDLFFSGREGNRVPFIVNARMAPSTGVVDLPFKAPEAGFYTIVIDDAQGQQVRRLLTHSKLAKGESVDWDGLDNAGQPAPAGLYRFRGLYHSGLGLQYLSSFHNPGNPTWRTADGKGEWGGDHSPPQTVATDGEGVYLGWSSAEDGDGIIKVDFDGKREWGYFQTPTMPAGTGAAYLATDGDLVYYLNDTYINPKKGEKELAYIDTMISCLDRKTGRRAGFAVGQAYKTLANYNSSQVPMSWWWDLWKDKSFSLDNFGVHDDYYYSGRAIGGNVSGLAARDGRIYVSFRLPQEIAVYNAADMTEITRWPLPKPAGLAFDKQGQLFAISDKSVVRIDLKTGKPTTVVTTGLQAPVGLAIGPDGDIYVSDWAAAQNVKVFSPKGKLVRTIGKEGGRPWIGKYDPNGMLLPRGIAIDKNGKLWVTEDDNYPRRISVWDAKTGKFEKEFIGGTNYGATSGAMIDPKNPTQAVSKGTLFEIDLTKDGHYKPLSTLWRRFARDEVFEPAERSITDQIIHHNGRRYYISSTGGAMLIGEIRDDMTYHPMVAVGGIFNRGDNPQVVAEDKLLWRHTVYPAFFAAHAGENYIWTDANGDGIPTEDEFQWMKQTDDFPCLGMYWGAGGVDEDFNLYVGGISKGSIVAKFDIQGWTEDGTPKYDFAHAKVLASQENGFRTLAISPDGSFYTADNGERIKPTYQPSLRGYAPDGKILWEYPTTADSRLMGTINGDGLLGPVLAEGETGEVLSLTQWHGLYVPFITTDGLFVGRVLRDPSEGGAPGPDMYRGETIQHLTRLDDGRIILSHGKNAHHLFEVTGFETVKRFKGEFTLTAEQHALAEERLKALKSKVEAAQPIVITNVTEPIAVDGKLDGWNWETATLIGPKDAVPHMNVAMATDGKMLFVAAKVTKNGGFKNDGQDPTQLFLSGDAVDLHFATDPAADPARKAAVMGDSRLILSKFEGKPVAVMYRSQVPGTKEPVSFSSPTRSVLFDEVKVLKDAKVEITELPDGYLVEAALPLKSLDFDPKGPAPGLWPGRVVQGDAGFIVADATGRRVARIYRFNQDTKLTADVPTEAALYPDKWGTFQVGPMATKKK